LVKFGPNLVQIWFISRPLNAFKFGSFFVAHLRLTCRSLAARLPLACRSLGPGGGGAFIFATLVFKFGFEVFF
jgi:hypothetical protein